MNTEQTMCKYCDDVPAEQDELCEDCVDAMVTMLERQAEGGDR